MASLNRVLLIGNLTRDPELRVTPKGTAICQFGLAMSRKFKDEAGAEKEEATFVDVEAWGKTGETIAKYCTKGKSLFIEGRLKFEQWEDKTTQQKRSKLKIVVENFQFLGGRDNGGVSPGEDAGPVYERNSGEVSVPGAHQRQPAPRAPAVPTRPPLPQPDINDEDVPF